MTINRTKENKSADKHRNKKRIEISLSCLDKAVVPTAVMADLEKWAQNDPDEYFWFRFVNVLNGTLHLTQSKIVSALNSNNKIIPQ